MNTVENEYAKGMVLYMSASRTHYPVIALTGEGNGAPFSPNWFDLTHDPP